VDLSPFSFLFLFLRFFEGISEKTKIARPFFLFIFLIFAHGKNRSTGLDHKPS